MDIKKCLNPCIEINWNCDFITPLYGYNIYERITLRVICVEMLARDAVERRVNIFIPNVAEAHG